MINLLNMTVKDAFQWCNEGPIMARMTDEISQVIKNILPTR